jgi:peptidoglycan/xylan/chitin deacetylase (PgdA/CDA1 family)
VRILMYHRFPNETQPLREQCQHLIRYYRPISLRTLVETLIEGAPLPTNAVVITVDDGYKDFYLYGYPVFREFGIPATIFLVSDFLDQKLWLWWDRIAWSFQESPLESVSFEWCDGVSKVFKLETADKRLASAQILTECLINLDNADRLKLLEDIPDLLQVKVPVSAPAKYESLTWAEAREMASNGIELGAHTRTHPILSRIKNSQTLADEIEGSKSKIEREVAGDVIHFCYPNGSAADFNEETIEIVKRSGFLSAVTTERGMNSFKSDPFFLRRTGIEPYGNTPYFRELLAGVRTQ